MLKDKWKYIRGMKCLVYSKAQKSSKEQAGPIKQIKWF